MIVAPKQLDRLRERCGARGERLVGFRRLANALWDPPSDPQIYGAVEVDAGPVLDFIECSRREGQHITPTHLVGRAVGHALRAVPALNVRLLRGRALPRESIDVFFIAAVKGGKDLSGVKIRSIDTKSARQVAEEITGKSHRLRDGDDAALARAKSFFDRLPRPIARLLLRVSAWAAGDEAWNLPLLGILATPFGSAMVSSVGMLGLPMGFAPIAWMYRVPLLILVGEIRDLPVALAGQVQIRPMLPLCATIDHRYVDGVEIARALDAMKEYLAHPERYEGAATPYAATPVAHRAMGAVSE